MTIYAFRNTQYSSTLTEFTSAKALAAEQARLDLLGDGTRVYRIDPQRARDWVKNGGHHETALWVDDGKVRRAGGGAY